MSRAGPEQGRRTPPLARPSLEAARRDALIDELTLTLIQEAAQLVRVVYREVGSDMPQSLDGLLKSLSDGPMRVSELAAAQGMARPTASSLLKQAQARGWVERARDPRDGRVVVMSMTAAGHEARHRRHATLTAVLKQRMSNLGDEEVQSALSASRILEAVVSVLRETTASSGPVASPPAPDRTARPDPSGRPEQLPQGETTRSASEARS